MPEKAGRGTNGGGMQKRRRLDGVGRADYVRCMEMSSPVRHRTRNLVHSALLILGMGGLAWVCTSFIWGGKAALWAFAGMTAVLIFAPSLPKSLVLSLYRAQPLTDRDFADGVALLDGLARQADLPGRPEFYYMPSSVPNAFSVGAGREAAVAVSDGLLRLLDPREFAAVMAHEVSHIAHRDTWIMGMADIMGRLTTISSYVGQFMLLINLPLILSGKVIIPWAVPIVLILSPTVMSLLQLALSRSREFDADLGAVRLTGDPVGLASALVKLEQSSGQFWEEMLLPGRRIPDPSMLRTHPKLEDRLARLEAVDPEAFAKAGEPPPHLPLVGWPPITARPRWHRTGVWY